MGRGGGVARIMERCNKREESSPHNVNKVFPPFSGELILAIAILIEI